MERETKKAINIELQIARKAINKAIKLERTLPYRLDLTQVKQGSEIVAIGKYEISFLEGLLFELKRANKLFK